MKKDAYYFSHDSNAQDDPKCMMIIDQLGMEGFGIFWALIEKLRAEKEYKLPLSVCQSFARRWNTSKEKVEAVILNYSLFVIEEDRFFYSKRLKMSMELKSLKAKESVNYRWGNTNVYERNTIDIRNDTIKVKESKVKESKVKENTPPSFDVFCEYAILKKPTVDKKALKLKYDSWIENNWHDGHGKQILNWKSKLLNTLNYISDCKNVSGDVKSKYY